jgi:DNA-binding FadR family transcriptional regulator
MEECGNVALGVMGKALQAVVERHMELAYRHDQARTPHQSQKLVRIGLRSHEKLVDLIEAGDGAGAEAHWINHMNAAGEFWLKNVAKTAVVDVLE